MLSTLSQQTQRLRNALRNRILNSVFSTIYFAVWRRAPTSICFVAATRLNEQDFWSQSLLGRSLKIRLSREGVTCRIKFNNKEGLPSIYNRAITEEPSDILVFLHDDVWLEDTKVLQKIREGLRKNDVIGVAGNMRRTHQQPAWLFTQGPTGNLVYDGQHLSGSIAHGQPGSTSLSDFGPCPRRCELMDGVFLAVKRHILNSSNITFDDVFKFHFYDMDFCRNARNNGLSLSTWPIEIIHLSAGEFGGPDWQSLKVEYFKKWKS